jgi:hypothetical protein
MPHRVLESPNRTMTPLNILGSRARLLNHTPPTDILKTHERTSGASRRPGQIARHIRVPSTGRQYEWTKEREGQSDAAGSSADPL